MWPNSPIRRQRSKKRRQGRRRRASRRSWRSVARRRRRAGRLERRGFQTAPSAEIAALTVQLAGAITDDLLYASDLARLTDYCRAVDFADAHPCTEAYNEALAAVSTGIDTLAATSDDDKLAEHLWEICSKAPADLPKGSDFEFWSPAEVLIASIAHHATPSVTLLFGRTVVAPTSLSVSIMQLWTARKFRAVIAAVRGGAGADALVELKDELTAAVRKYALAEPSPGAAQGGSELVRRYDEAMAKWEAALAKSDAVGATDAVTEVRGLRDKLLERMARPRGGGYAGQQALRAIPKAAYAVLSFLGATLAMISALRSKGPVMVLDYFSAAVQAAQGVVLSLESFLTLVGYLENWMGVLTKLGLGLSAVGAVLGILQGVLALASGELRGAASHVASTCQLVGNVAIVAGMFGKYIGVALASGANAVGIVLVLAGFAIAIYTAAAEKENHTSVVARAILDRLEQNAIFRILWDEPEFRARVIVLAEGLRDTYIPYAPNNPYVARQLEALGFDQACIGAIVGGLPMPMAVGDPLAPASAGEEP